MPSETECSNIMSNCSCYLPENNVPITKHLCGKCTESRLIQNSHPTDFACIWILQIIPCSYYVRWVKGLCMAVNINIKGLHHDRRLFKSAENGHYVTSTLWKNLPNFITNSTQPHIPLGAWCRYNFVKHCTYILLCIFIFKTSPLLDQKWYSTWLSALKDMRSVHNYSGCGPFCNSGSP